MNCIGTAIESNSKHYNVFNRSFVFKTSFLLIKDFEAVDYNHQSFLLYIQEKKRGVFR